MISVLYADEEAGLLELAKIYLERHGDLQVDPVPSGVHALAALQRQPYDVVVSDYLMPGMNGIELLKALRGQGFQTPFILFTGRGREEVVIEALNNGASFYLQKGGDPKAQFAELRHMILQSVQKRVTESSLQATQYSVDHASDEVFWSDADGKFQYVNEAACRSLGYPRHELLALSVFDIDTVCTKEVWQFLVAQIRAGHMAPVQSCHRRKDGTTFPVEISCSYVKLDDREYIFAYSRDITARVQAETALRESEEKYRYLVEVNRDIIFTMDTSGRILYVSSQVVPQLGFRQDEVIGRQFTEFLHPDDARFLAQHVRDHFISMADIPGDQFRLCKKDGTCRWFEDKSIYVTDSRGNKIMVGALRDITDRRMAEEALRESEERYRAVVESQTEMISRFTPEGVHTFVNEAYCRYFGLRREEIIAHRFIPNIPIDDRQAMRDHLAALSPQQPVGRIVHRIVLPDGSVHWQRWIDQAIYDDTGQLVEYQSVGRDITEERENEELAKASTQRFADIINFLPDATFVIDREKKVIAWNQAVERMTGVEGNAIIGQGDYAYAVPFYG
ncbi:MAG: PAS domain S-box protein, partial [Methanobacteriota archaeon]